MTSLLLNADLMNGDPLNAAAWQTALDRGLPHISQASWPTRHTLADTDLPLLGSRTDESRVTALVEVDAAVALVTERGGTVHCQAFAPDPDGARAALTALREVFPRSEPEGETVPVTFWTYSAHGPRSLRRELDAPEWTAIAPNYSEGTREALEPLIRGFRPGRGGQLLLWSGEPGTGKTTALRALAREWREWCEIHYVIDPEHFFGDHADYMIDVMVQDTDAYTADEEDGRERWRLLVLEDAGELIQRDARAETGQALSRFLNVVDGLIGQGLRVLVLVTTNEETGKLHPAVSRPGRTAARVGFDRLTEREAREWLERHGAGDLAGESRTLAELYALVEGFESPTPAAAVGFVR